MLPHDLPPRPDVYQQMQRWTAAKCLEAIEYGLRMRLRRTANGGPSRRKPANDDLLLYSSRNRIILAPLG